MSRSQLAGWRILCVCVTCARIRISTFSRNDVCFDGAKFMQKSAMSCDMQATKLPWCVHVSGL